MTRRIGYHVMTKNVRLKIEALYNAGVKVAKISEELGYTQKSIYAELKKGFYMHRNHDWTETKKYSADKADAVHQLHKTAKGAPIKLSKDYKFARFVEKMILQGYSPEATLLYIKENNLRFDTKVCVTTLYSYIDKGVFLKISNSNLLHKGKRRKRVKQGKMPKRLPRLSHSIEERTSEINARLEFDHWEGDTVIGTKRKGDTLLTFTERQTRMEIVIRSRSKEALSTVEALNYIEYKIGSGKFKNIFKSITFDNGTEFSDTEGLEYSPFTKEKRTTVYYCHPYASSERGTNENQNGFIRRFIPKGTAISAYDDTYISSVQRFINTYPRGIFGGENALKRFKNSLLKINIKKIPSFFT